jgi:ABC-type spermidine/putrescine transport system permease subunit II
MSIGQGTGIAQRAMEDVYPPPKSKPASRRSFGVAQIALLFVMLYLLIPLGATLWFGINTGNNFDFSSYQRIFSDPDFSQTFITSLELAAATTILAVVLVTPTAYWVQMRIPRARPLLDFLTLVPFAIPAIVLGVGLLQEYSGTANPLISVKQPQYCQYPAFVGMRICNYCIAVRLSSNRQQPARNQYICPN